MPFVDLNQQEISFTRDAFDVVIIGAGAAGILLALKLSERGKKVLLLESGHFTEDEHRQSLNEVEQTGKLLGTAVWGRKRAIGGTTIAWGGQSLPFSSVDFSERPWIANSGWPLKLADLAGYYPLANRFMKIDELDYDKDILELFHFDKPGFDQEKIWYHFAKWAPEPDFRRLYGDDLSRNVTVVYNAVMTRIDIDDVSGRVDSITISNYNDRQYKLPVQQLIIAAGGIETNRILLSNNHQSPAGLGGESGWLGKCFMEHPCTELGVVTTTDPYRLQYYFNTHIARKRRYSIRLSLTEKYQQDFKSLNASASIMFDYPGQQFDPYLEIRNFIRNRKFSGSKNLLTNTKAYALSTKAYLADKFYYKHKATARLVTMIEQEPLRESFISLSNRKDRFGTNLARINWQVSKKSWDTAIGFTGMLKEEFHRLSIGELTTLPKIDSSNDDWESCLTDVNHHMGGTRMSESPREGVVNKNMQVWGHDNLYLCSTSIYPTSSHSNPTLTLLALSLRLVDFLTLAHSKT
jgi:choline dehydrogenase-like flavoprotein